MKKFFTAFAKAIRGLFSTRKAKKMWIVVKDEFTPEEQSRVICGVYHEMANAFERVDELFMEEEERFEDAFHDCGWTSDNHHNGYAELYAWPDLFHNVNIVAFEVDVDVPLQIPMSE